VRTVLVGLGAVGARSARQLLSSRAVRELVVFSRHPSRVEAIAAAIGGSGAVRLEELSLAGFSRELGGADVVVLASPVPGYPLAKASLEAGVPVVSVSDDPDEVQSLLQLDEEALARGLPLALGAGMAPGLSCLLATWAAQSMDDISEVHVATLGTGGPACAKRRHAALREAVEEWHDGSWVRKVASSGRELVWFPGQTGADCYRVNRADAILLARAFPALRSVTTRAAASRRDRLTSWLPMLRPPHPEGTVGAVRVEARGWRGHASESVLIGARGRPALLAGTVAAATAVRAATGQLRSGAGGLASLVVSPGELLAELSQRGVSVMTFEGATSAS
jgi:saccharopine dehydrogenase-like NADP-dependent oxidoreductase